MITIVFFALKDAIYRCFRRLVWLVKLGRSDLGKNIQINFPVIREGKGKLQIGDNTKLMKYAQFGVGEKGTLSIGNSSFIDNESVIIIKKECNFLINDNFKLGKGSRIYTGKDWSFGKDVKIETYCSIFSRESEEEGVLRIGNGTHIGDYTIIDVVADVIIGDNVAIGPHCTLYTHDHKYDDKSLPSWKGGLISESIDIANGAWIGANVTILPGVKIGERAVVAAASVVTKDVDSNSIYGGIPAKLIKRI